MKNSVAINNLVKNDYNSILQQVEEKAPIIANSFSLNNRQKEHILKSFLYLATCSYHTFVKRISQEVEKDKVAERFRKVIGPIIDFLEGRTMTIEISEAKRP